MVLVDGMLLELMKPRKLTISLKMYTSIYDYPLGMQNTSTCARW